MRQRPEKIQSCRKSLLIFEEVFPKCSLKQQKSQASQTRDEGGVDTPLCEIYFSMNRVASAPEALYQTELTGHCQLSLIMNGACPSDLFLSRLAAFFSLAVRADGFLASLLLR